MKRCFRHEGEGRSWWIEMRGRELLVGFSDDSDPEPVERVRREANEAAARAELERLVAEQLAEGFVEHASARASEGAFFDACLSRWAAESPEVPAQEWRDAVAALPIALRDRYVAEVLALPGPASWKDATWLRMQAPVQPAPFLLSLRDPAAGGFALWVMDAFVVPRPLGASRMVGMGALDHAPLERAPHLELALLSLVAAPTEASAAGATAIDRFPWSEASLTRMIGWLKGEDRRAVMAAKVLAGVGRPDLSASVREWLESSGVSAGIRTDIARRMGMRSR